jgi:hypothetical protein
VRGGSGGLVAQAVERLQGGCDAVVPFLEVLRMQENRTWRFGVLVIVDWSWIVQIYFGSKFLSIDGARRPWPLFRIEKVE